MPFTTSWNTTTIAYDVQNARRSNNRVRSTTRSSTAAPTTPHAAARV
jgi:hypothetical protein